VTNKICKYCKKPGIFIPRLNKVLCQQHNTLQKNLKNFWDEDFIPLEMLEDR